MTAPDVSAMREHCALATLHPAEHAEMHRKCHGTQAVYAHGAPPHEGPALTIRCACTCHTKRATP